jgi:hypothetical protein
MYFMLEPSTTNAAEVLPAPVADSGRSPDCRAKKWLLPAVPGQSHEAT